MKKLLTLTMVLGAFYLVPQMGFAQTEIEPAKDQVKIEKQVTPKKEVKGEVVPKRTTNADQKANSITPPPAAKQSEQKTTKNYIVPSKDKPKEAVIRPIKNPKKNKVTQGKVLEEKDKNKDKEKDKNKDKNQKLHSLKKMD